MNDSSPERVRDEHKSPWQRLKGELIGGVAFTGFGLILATLGTPSELTCHRLSAADPSCQLEWPVLFGLVPIRSSKIEGLHGVELVRLVSSPEERGQVVYYRAILKTAGGEVTMNPGAGEEAVLQATEAIEGFLADPAARSMTVFVPRAGGYAWLGRIGDILTIFGLSYALAIPLRIAQIINGRAERS